MAAKAVRLQRKRVCRIFGTPSSHYSPRRRAIRSQKVGVSVTMPSMR